MSRERPVDLAVSVDCSILMPFCHYRPKVIELSGIFLRKDFTSRFFCDGDQSSRLQEKVVQSVVAHDKLSVWNSQPRFFRLTLKRYEAFYWGRTSVKKFQMYTRLDTQLNNKPDPQIFHLVDDSHLALILVKMSLEVVPVFCRRPVFYDFLDAALHRRAFGAKSMEALPSRPRPRRLTRPEKRLARVKL